MASAMDDGTLKNIVGQKITGSLGFMGGTLSKERLEAEKYYKGEPFGDEQVGRSQVISRDVAESVDSMLPPLLKVFTSGSEMVRFDPRRPEHEEMAQQQTEYVNWVWFTKNRGFNILHDWFKDGLYKKLGVIKLFWETKDSVQKETYEGLTDQEFQILSSDPAVEIVEHEQYSYSSGEPALGPLAAKDGASPGATLGAPGAMMAPPPAIFHNVVLKRSKQYGCVRILNVPPDEFLIDHRAVTLEEAGFLCHRRKATLTELKEAGFDTELVDSLGPDGANDFNMERVERFKDEDAYPYRDDNYVDPSMREVWINECYVKIDYDGDGFAELRQVILAGESTYVLLSNEEVDDHPFATLTPIPMPHKVFGFSIADQTMDIQRIKSALWRGALDSIYFSIAPQVGMVEGQVNLDDLLNRRPGGVVRMKNANAIVPLPTQALASDAFTMIEYADAVRESRTGVRRFNSTLDADQINPLAKTATAAMLADNAAADRLQLIARIFAETGVKEASRKILELACKHQTEPEIMRLRGKYVPIDPREWTTEMDITVSVGLGTGNRDAQLQHLMAVAPIYQQLLTVQQGVNGPFILPQHLYHFLSKIIEFSELGDAEYYFNDPTQNPTPPQPPPPNPEMMKAQAELQMKQQEFQLKAQLDQQQAQHKAQIEMATMERQSQIEAEQAKADMLVQQQKAGLELELAKQRAAVELTALRQKHAIDMRGKVMDMKIKARQARQKPQAQANG